MGSGFGFSPRGMAELHLTAAIGQFFGNHAVTAGPAVMQRVSGALRVGATRFWQDQVGRVFMARAAVPTARTIWSM